MTSETKKEVAILCLIGVIVLLIITLVIEKIDQRQFKQQAISLNHAEYNSTYGNWQWKTNSVERK